VRCAAELAGAAALVVLAACHEGVGPGACFEPNAHAYNFDYNGDTAIVFHWPSSYMPVRVYAEPAGNLPANVQTAMQLWTGAFRCHELALTAATDSAHADIIVRNPGALPPAPRAARVMHADSVGACLGVTQFNTNATGTALAGPMRSFVAPFPGKDSTAVAACYHFITAHELGHALGLLSHSPDTNDLMFATPSRLALSEADRYTIQLLYHVASKLGPPPRP
jgi:predicted Zn-dependent protease